MKKSTLITKTFVAAFILIMAFMASATQAADKHVVPGYTLKAGNPANGVCDTLMGAKNLYRDFRAKNPDGTVNAVIEIPAGTNDKWETDTATGRLFWELKNGAPRVVQYQAYPADYGMIPRTRGGDGDPLDIIVLGGLMRRGAVGAVRPIGVFFLEDGGKIDDKIIAVLPGSFMGSFTSINEADGLFPGMLSIISTWFSNYKGIGGGLVAKGFGDADTAMTIIDAAITNKDTTSSPLTPLEWPDDSLTADGYTRTTGAYGQTLSGVLGSCDSLSNGKNEFLDNKARTAEKMTVTMEVEIPAGTNAKWQTEKSNGVLYWENQLGIRRNVRFLGYPGNYGQIPHTLSGDGDALDVLLFGIPKLRGEVLPVKIIGCVYLIDAGQRDHKFIAVLPGAPMGEVNTLSELDAKYPGVAANVQTWLTSYKGLAGGLFSSGFGQWDTASKILDKGIADYGDPVKQPTETTTNRQFFKVVPIGRKGSLVKVSFSLTHAERVKINLYSLAGERLSTLTDKKFTSGGHSFSWSGRTRLAGSYIMKMEAGGQTQTRAINLFR